MYADDTILYFEYPGPSLASALQAIDQPGAHSGLHVNWYKAQIISLHHFPPTANQVGLPLASVALLRYHGIWVSWSIMDYIPLKIESLFTPIKQKTQIWAKLPLGVMGINVIKMVLLHVFWHSLFIYL